jgi:hypothetical protein
MLFTAFWDDECSDWSTEHECWNGAMTHWRPLPSPPSQEEEQGSTGGKKP